MTGEQRAGTAPAYGVSDEEWREIAVEGERASASERRALVRAAGAVGVLIVGATALALSGLVTARLSSGSSGGGGSETGARTAFVEFELHNQGVTPVHVIRWTSRLPGVEVVRAEPAAVGLSPRGSEQVRVTVHVSDCAAAVPAARRGLKRSPMSGRGLDAVVDRPWGPMASVVYPVSTVEDGVLSACGVDLTTE
ncbi:MAG: hypothetical protein HOP99_08055 [Dermatophilaceae bacterium]|nr:hypothetical protein [Dermatophilaceae bacterium]